MTPAFYNLWASVLNHHLTLMCSTISTGCQRSTNMRKCRCKTKNFGRCISNLWMNYVVPSPCTSFVVQCTACNLESLAAKEELHTITRCKSVIPLNLNNSNMRHSVIDFGHCLHSGTVYRLRIHICLYALMCERNQLTKVPLNTNTTGTTISFNVVKRRRQSKPHLTGNEWPQFGECPIWLVK